jgi:hypothetical protein
VAIAMKVAPATSCVRLRSGNVMEGKWHFCIKLHVSLSDFYCVSGKM